MAARSWFEHVGVIADRGRAVLNLPGGRQSRDARQLCERLLAQRGEAAGIALASDLVDEINAMDGRKTADFLRLLAASFAPDPAGLDRAIERWRAERDVAATLQLQAASEPPRQELFRRLNMAPGGTRTLVNLRASLLGLNPDPDLEALDFDLRHLLSSWFNRGFLQLQEISWETPAAILERLIEYEAVHAIQGWADLRLRLAEDRRCYAFFHPALPGEPLIFVEVALSHGLATAIGPVIDARRKVGSTKNADTATFYSISNCQKGLRGISFGNFLIKQVVSELSAALPGLKTFATLSPVPGLAASLVDEEDSDGFTDARLRALIGDQADELNRLAAAQGSTLRDLLTAPAPRPERVNKALKRLALAYLTRQRRSGRSAADPVAHFHLANGARLEQINVDADLSEGGHGSCGVMVNYLYEPERLEFNHERYVETGEVVTGRSLNTAQKRVQAAWSAR